MSLDYNDADKQELLNEFGEDYIKKLVEYIRALSERFIQKHFITEKVFVDDYLLMLCLVDTLFDIKRLKHFHHIEFVNNVKLHAYLASWFLRRKPIQRKLGCERKLFFVNEMFINEFLLNSLDKPLHDVNVYNQDKAKELSIHLFYHLKYRNTNPQTLELFLTGLNTVG